MSACQPPASGYYQGYAEGEYVRIASPLAGRLTVLSAERGTRVTAGAPLFTLEQENEQAAREEAEQRLQRAQAQLENLKKGKRPTEIAAVEAQLAQAQAALKLAGIQLRRQERLGRSQFASKDTLDGLRAAYERDQAQVEALSAEVATARLPARIDEIAAAAADMEAARAALEQAEWKLAQKTVSSPVAGEIADHVYVAGDWVPAGDPVIVLLPPQNIKVRFFIPEPDLGKVRTGEEAVVSCDGCPNPLAAKVSFIATQAEYTPPVIYSMDNRAKLVYLVEARLDPADAVKLHPGQPVDVRLPR